MKSLPYVTVKYAASLDGRIATKTGDSQWISCAETLQLAHQLRAEHDAIMVGIGTVLADNPRLDVRLVEGRNPLRVIIDSYLQIPLEANVLKRERAKETLIVTTEAADKNRLAEIKNLGAEVLVLSRGEDKIAAPRVGLEQLLSELSLRHIKTVLVEGGSKIITGLLAAHLVNRLIVVVAPKIIGQGIEAIGDLGITRLSDAITFASVKTERLGTDVVFDCLLQ